jgi:hypothetical protein
MEPAPVVYRHSAFGAFSSPATSKALDVPPGMTRASLVYALYAFSGQLEWYICTYVEYSLIISNYTLIVVDSTLFILNFALSFS